MINHKPTREKIYREVYQTLISDTKAQLQEARIKRDEAYEELVKYGILRSLPDRESELINPSTQIQILRDAAEEVKYLTDKLEKLKQYDINNLDEQIEDIRRQIWEGDPNSPFI